MLPSNLHPARKTEISSAWGARPRPSDTITAALLDAASVTRKDSGADAKLGIRKSDKLLADVRSELNRPKLLESLQPKPGSYEAGPMKSSESSQSQSAPSKSAPSQAARAQSAPAQGD